MTLMYCVFVPLAMATSAPEPVASPAPAGVHQRARAPRRAVAGSEELFSLRARRRFAAYLRLRLLELREAGLERAAAVIERRLPVDALIPKR